MSDVTFTPEQIREIRRRIEELSERPTPWQFRKAVLAAFPLPKVTRPRTFTMTWGHTTTYTYRVNGEKVEWLNPSDSAWEYSRLTKHMAHDIAALGDWTALAAFADVCARPTEEVDA